MTERTPTWLVHLLPAFPAASRGDEEARRRLFVALVSVLAVPILLYYAWSTLAAGIRLLPQLCLLGAAVFTGTFLAVRVGDGRSAARLAVLTIMALLVTSLMVAGGHSSLIWIVPLPLMLTFVFGRVEGAVWSVCMLLGFLLLLIRPHWFGVPTDAPSWPWRGAIEDFFFAFVLVAVFSLALETLRLSTRERLAEAITAYEERVARTRDFNEIGTDLLFELDAELRVTDLSGSWRELTGIATEDIVGLHFTENADGYTRTGWEPVAAKLAARQTVRDEPITFHLRDGRDLTILVRAVPRFDDRGVFLGYRGVGVDQTARAEAERALREKDRALQHATRMEAVGQLTSGVAHDFNNLLTVIMGNLELLALRTGEAAGAASEELDQATAAARRAAELTGKLLAFSRRQALRPERIDVAELLLEAQTLFARTLPEHITVRMHVDAAVEPCRADRTQLESTLLNLALNARDAMPEGGELVLSAENATLDATRAATFDVDPGPWVLLRVRDTGAGMPADLLEHVFEPFFTTKPAGKGTGLGLSMVYGFLRQSGGSVRIDSAPGAGTTVELLLPRAGASDAAEAAPGRPSRHSGGGRRALVLEDEAGVRSLVASMLSRLGYSVVAVSSGDEAIAAFDAAPCAVLVSDVVLSGPADGIEILAALRARAPGMPAVLMSGYSDALFRAGDQLPEGVLFLAKPFGLGALQQALESLFDAPASAPSESGG